MNHKDSTYSCGLAPMEGVTDLATRLWFAKTSNPEFCWTPFHRATYTSTGKLPEEYAPELNVLKNYIPYRLIPQVMTGDPGQFCVVAEKLLEDTPYVDLNCGCPSPTVVGRGAGSSVLETADKFADLVSNISRRLGANKLSVKMRLGFHTSQEIYRLLESIHGIQLQHLTIHGRTRAQKYLGRADWELITWASEQTNFSIVGSGDVFSHVIYDQTLMSAPRIQTRIIGRGAVRNPWIFSEIRSKQNQKISLEALLFALASFAKLQEIEKRQFEELLILVKEGLFLESCETDEQKWRRFYFKISKLQDVADLQLSSFGLARLKMVWNHLRTSLPNAFWVPDPLRCKNTRDFFDCIRKIGGENISFEIKHEPEWDWLFGGKKKNPVSPS